MRSALPLTLILCLVSAAVPVAAQEKTETPGSFDARSPATRATAAGPLARAITIEAVRLAAAGETTSSSVDAVQPGGKSARSDWSRVLKVGDTIFVTDRQGRETRGKLQRLSSTSLVVVVNGDEREIQSAEIGRIEKPDPVWNSALIGAALLAFPAMGGAGASCSPNCARDVTLVTIGAAIGGAFLGARIDRSFEGRTLVYGDQPDSPHAFHPSRPVTAFGELWMRVRSGDIIDVVDTSGRKTTGTFAQASASSIALLADGQRQEISVSEVRRVARRGTHLRTGVLVGAAVGAIGGVMHCQAESGPSGCPNPIGSAIGDGAIGGVGAGALIGWLIPKRTVVYRSTADPAAGAPSQVNLAVSGVVSRQEKAVGIAVRF